MKNTAQRLLVLTLPLLALPFQLAAFSEDLCVGQVNVVGAPIRNCLEARFCGPDAENVSACRANVMLDAAVATVASTGTARSMLHTDATHFLAQLVGIDPAAAYWIAAYDQVTDVESYVPFGMRGQQIRADRAGNPVIPLSLNGWGRSAPDSGGFMYHFVTPYFPDNEEPKIACGDAADESSVCGIAPNLEDSIHEGMLNHMRAWAMGWRDGSCVNGFTNPDSDGGYFTGDTCYKYDSNLLTDPESVIPYIRGLFPTFTQVDGAPLPFSSYNGKAIAQYKARSLEQPAISNVVYAEGENFSSLLELAYGEELPLVLNGRTSEEYQALIRTGLYLHSVQDRISHHECTDVSPVRDPDSLETFFFRLDTEACTADYHAFGHFQEMGQNPLPDRTINAVQYTLNELILFTETYPEWLDPAAARFLMNEAQYTQYLENAVAALLNVLKVGDGCFRLKAMIDLNQNYGFLQLPGNHVEDSFGMCLYQGQDGNQGQQPSSPHVRLPLLSL